MRESAETTGKTVLLADDEDGMRNVIARRLSSWGYAVVLAKDGEEAVRLAKERRPDLILLDVMMPTLSGLEACQQLKSAPETQHIPVIFVTAKASQLSGETVKAAGASACLGKPYDPSELRGLVEQALRR